MSDGLRILVRGPNWLGDLVMATPGFRALREAFPRAEIVLHARASHLPLMSASPWFDRLLSVRSYHRGAAEMAREAYMLRGRRFDLGLCLPDSVSAALLMRLAGPRRVVGYPRLAGRWLLDDGPPAPPPLTPRERHVLALVEHAIGDGRRRDHRVELFVDDESEALAAALRREAGIASGEPLALFAPGASFGPSKCWPASSFADVADALSRDGVRTAVIGAPEERILGDRVVEAAHQPVLNWCGSADLRTLKALVRDARVLVCNDAGARHIAVALGTPCIAIFGPTSIHKTGLNLERVQVFASQVGCRPCYHRVCPIDHRCMTRIDAAWVVEAARACLTSSEAS